jgi:Glycoside-hydrolase family GH114
MPRISTTLLAAALVCAGVAAGVSSAVAAASWRPPPAAGHAQWYWEIDPPRPGLAGLPPVRADYPAPGSANVWDTDLFADSNRPGGAVPTGPSPVVSALRAAGKYSICYVEAGAWQSSFPDRGDFSPADYGHRAQRYQLTGFGGEWWFDLRGFSEYVPGRPGTLRGAAPDIARGLARRIHECALEGQDALEPDDLDGYTNRGGTGVAGGGWHLTRADSLGFERWLAHTAHADGLAIFQKNDDADSVIDAHTFDGMINEECNHYRDPCAGPGGDGTPYLRRGKPVLNAEYTADGETTTKFCAADRRAQIAGALFNVALDGRVYGPCAPASP